MAAVRGTGRIVMRRSVKNLSFLAVVLIAGCLAAGCGGTVASSVSSAIKSAASSLPTQTAATATTESAPATPTQTAANTPAPTTAPAAAPAEPASTPASSSSGSSLVWLWVLLGAAAIAGLMVWITRMSRRGHAPAAADWQSGLVDAYAKGSALHDAMSAAETPGAMATDDAGVRWADIQRRADDLSQTLYALREAAPDPASQARVADTLASLQAARSAMDAERTPGGAGPQQAEVVRGRLYAFESSLQMLRAGTQRYP
jgi:hypothetical protein